MGDSERHRKPLWATGMMGRWNGYYSGPVPDTGFIVNRVNSFRQGNRIWNSEAEMNVEHERSTSNFELKGTKS